MSASESPALEKKPVEESPALKFGGQTRCSGCFKRDASLACAACALLVCTECAFPTSWFTLATHHDVQPLRPDTVNGSVFCARHWTHRLSPTGVFLVLCLVGGFVAILLGLGTLALPLWVLCVLAKRQHHQVDSWLRGSRLTVAKDVCGVYPHYEFVMSERASINFSLGIDSKPYAAVGPLTGTMTMSLILPESSHAVAAEGISTLHAGFAQLIGREDTQFDEPEDFDVSATKAISFKAPVPPGFDLRQKRQQAIGKTWTYRSYKPNKQGSIAELPFSVTPAAAGLSLNTHSWGLEFRVPDSVNRILIRELRVTIPPELESVSYTDGLVEKDRAQIIWRDLVATAASPAAALVEFTQPIHHATTIEAAYDVEIDNYTSSGLRIEQNRVWRATGRPVEPKYVSEKRLTTFSGVIRSATWLYPKFEEVISRRRRDVRIPMKLDLSLAHAAIQHLAQNDLYMKDIAASHEGGTPENHYWEIIGRRYVNDQPYDIHIVFSGEDEPGGTEEFRVMIDVVVRTLSQLPFVMAEKQHVEALADDLLISTLEVFATR